MQQDAKEFVKKTLASELQVREESARKSKESIDKIKNALLDYEQVQKQVTEVQKDSSEKIAERYQAISDKIK
jgi:hypothetical protein